MKNIFLLFLLLGSSMQSAYCQALKKYAVGKSGCSVMFYCNPGNFEENISPDSSVVYSGECTASGITYQLICVKLVKAAPTMELAEQVLGQYLDFLKGSYDITTAKGYTKGHQLKTNAKVRGIADTWNDKDNNHLDVKGWTDGHFIAVLIAISTKDQANPKVNAFLDGIVFPK